MLRGGEECIRSYAGSDESAAGNGKGGNAVNRKMIYGKVRKICKTLQTLLDTLKMFPRHREELLEMFNYKMFNLKDPSLWE